MVRLRSNRWYSRENQHRMGRRVEDSSSGRRRLISLIFLLGLVILLMQRASDPTVIRQAFDSLGVPLDRDTVAQTHPDSIHDSTEFAANEGPKIVDEDPVWASTCRDLAARILDAATPAELNEFAEFWFSEAERGVGSRKPVSDWLHNGLQKVSQVRERLDSISDGPIEWRNAVDQFQKQWQIMLDSDELSSEIDTPSTLITLRLDPVFHREINTQLDQRLIELLRNASPWTPSERIAFWRLLQRGREYDYSQPDDPPQVTTHQLERSFDRYRGSWIRFRGSVRRVEFVERSHPLFDGESYWVLWLKGADGSSQPVAVYSAHPLAAQLQLGIESGSYPEIEIIALAGKRLAYGSQAGVQVAPTLFAGSIIQFVPDVISGSRRDPRDLAWPMASAALVAILLSLAILLPLWPHLRKGIRGRRSGSMSGAKTILFAIASTAAMLPCAAQQQTPPWVADDAGNQSLSRIIEMRLAEAFSEVELGMLENFLEGTQSQPPDGLVKVFHAIDQTGWHRAWAVMEPISVGRSIQIVPLQIRGWAQRLEAIELTDQQRLWFSLDDGRRLYRLQVNGAELLSSEIAETTQINGGISSQQSTVPMSLPIFCFRVPTQWLGHSELNQPVVIRGFALKVADASDPPGLLPVGIPICLLAESPGWILPGEELDYGPSLKPQIPKRWFRLGSVGWDLSWLDLLEKNHQKPISSDETLALLSLLRIVSTRDQPFDLDFLSDQVEPLETLNNPLRSVVAPVDWIVRLVSGSQVELPSGSIPGLPVDGEGIAYSSHSVIRYYQYDGFVKLPGQRINYQTADRSQSIQFDGEYPVTILMSEESEFVKKNRLGESEPTWNIGRTARVRGRFFRLWSYQSERLSSSGSQHRQVAPLVIAATLEPASPKPLERAPIGWFGLALTGLVAMIMAGILYSVIREAWMPRRRSGRKHVSGRSA